MRSKRRPFEYRIVVRYSEEDEGYIAVVPELRGCSAWGETEQEALKAVEEAARAWLESAKANGIEIPVPLDKQPVSGKYHLRMPPDLYRELAFEAKAQGLSLNQFIVHKLSRTPRIDKADIPRIMAAIEKGRAEKLRRTKNGELQWRGKGISRSRTKKKG